MNRLKYFCFHTFVLLLVPFYLEFGSTVCCLHVRLSFLIFLLLINSYCFLTAQKNVYVEYVYLCMCVDIIEQIPLTKEFSADNILTPVANDTTTALKPCETAYIYSDTE